MQESPWTQFLRKLFEAAGSASECRRGRRRFIPEFDLFEPRLTPAAPAVLSINRVGAAISSANALEFAVTFSQPVTGVDAGDFQVAKTGTIATTFLQAMGSGTTYTVTVGGISGGGTVGVNLVDNGSIRGLDNVFLAPEAAPFANQVTYATSSSAPSVVAADVNDDGKLDLVTASASAPWFGVLLGNGDGTFKPQTTFTMNGTIARTVAVAEINGDGRPDVIISRYNGQGISTFLGNGDGTFKPSLNQYAAGPMGLAVGDVNGDGWKDLAVPANVGSSSVGVFLNVNHDGTFQTPPIDVPTNLAPIWDTLVDINGDGKLDIVTSSHAYASVSVMLGCGNGTFMPQKSFAAKNFTAAGSVGDLNGDGKLDVVVANKSGSISVLLGNGDGTLRPQTTFAAGSNPRNAFIADINNDGRPDLVVSNMTNGAVNMLFGNGDGTFSPPTPLALGPTTVDSSEAETRQDALADLNGDLRPDIVTANGFANNSVSVVVVANASFTGQTATMDREAPLITITSQPPANALNQTAQFAFSASDPVVGNVASGIDHLEYKLDGGAFTTAVSPVTLTGLAPGNHAFAVYAVDVAGNVSATASYSWNVDLVSPPSVASVTRTTPVGPATNGSSVVFTVTFSGIVGGVDPSDFAAVTSGTSTAGAIVVAGSGDTYTVTLSGISGEGTLALRVKDDDTIISTVNGLPIGGAGVDNGAIVGPAYLVDHTPPTAAITAQPPLITLSTSATFSFTGNDPTGNGVSSGVHHFEYSLDGGSFNVATSPLTLNSLSIANHLFQVRAVDMAGNVSTVASYAWTVAVPPSVRSIGRTTPSAEFTTAASVVYTVTFDQPVTGVDATDFRVFSDNVLRFDPSLSVAGGGSSYTVTIGGILGTGQLRLDLVDNDSILSLGYPLGSAGPFNGSFRGASYTIAPGAATIAPFVQSITRVTPTAARTVVTSATFAVVFSEAVTGVDASDFQLVKTGTANGVLSSFTATDAANYVVTVSNIAGLGQIGLNLVDNGSIRDSDGLILVNKTTFFSDQVPLDIVQAITAQATVDLNGDGNVDIVTSQSDGGSYNIVRVFLSNGDGTFKPSVTFATAPFSRALAVADINGDGKPDLVTGGSGAALVSILLGNGNGMFQSAQTMTAITPYALSVADMNGDGKLDLVMTLDARTGVGIKLGNGDGTFGNEVTFAATAREGLAVADVNGDQRLDVIAGSRSSSTSSRGYFVFLGNGDGSLRPAVSISTTFGAGTIAVGDLNNDGKADLLACRNNSEVAVSLGNGDGSFQPLMTFATMSVATSISIGDINRDGVVDVMTANQTAGNATLLLGNGNGTFKPQTVYPLVRDVRGGSIADVNGDGRPDYVSINTYNSKVRILFGQDGRFTGDSFFEDTPQAGAWSSVVSITANTSSNANSIAYAVTFSEPVTGVDASDFAVTVTGTVPGAPAIAISGSGASYTATVSGITGDGTLALNLVGDNSIRDLDNNPLMTAAGAFSNQTTFSTGADLISIAAADLNGDNKLDLVAGSRNSLALCLFLGNGDGTYKPVSKITATVNQPNVTTADLNKDGKTDIIVGTGQSSSLLVYLGNGDATFRPPVSISLAGAGFVDTADMNADGSLDIVCATGNVVAVVLGNGDGTFRPVINTTAQYASSVAIRDINDDNKLDVVCSITSGQSVGVLLGNGDGTLRPKVDYSIFNLGAVDSVAIGDLNLDGKPDIAFGGPGAGVFFGNGDGTFGNRITMATANRGVHQIVVNDINRDGRPDLVVANDGLGYLLGNGDGTFGPFTSLAAQTGENGLVVTDLNSDGRADIAGAGNASKVVGVLIAKRGDFSGQAATIDYTAPTATIGTRPAAFTKSTAAAFTFTGSDPTAGGVTSGVNHFEYQLDSGNFTTAASPLTLTVLTSGTHTFRVRAVDNAGNSGAVAAYSWFVDLTTGVQSINRLTPTWALTAESSVTYQVTFGLPVTGVDASDFSISFAGVTIVPPIVVSMVSSGVYNVTLSGIAGSGTLALNLVDDGSIRALDGTLLAAANAVPSFQPKQTFAAGAAPLAPVLADLNGDGKLDFLAGNFTDGSVSVFLGNGNGSFQAQRSFAAGAMPTAIAVGDLNGDGKADLVVGNTDNTAAINVLLGNGDGSFQTATTLAAGAGPVAIAIGDVSGDGKADIAVVNKLVNAVSVLVGNGDGSFAPRQTFATGALPRALALGDLNGDGKLDLLSANDAGNVSVLLGNGNGTFQAQASFAAGVNPSSVAIGDIDVDGELDFAVSSAGNNIVNVFMGNGNGTFQAVKTFAASGSPLGIAIANLNGDAKPDLVVSGGNGRVGALLGNGNGTFQTMATFAGGNGAVLIALGDVSGDGRADLAMTDAVTPAVALNALKGDFAGTGYTFNQIAPLATLTGNTIHENNNIGDFIGVLAANDPGAGGTFSFALPAGMTDNAAFALNAGTLTAAVSFDYETKRTYTITVRVTHVSGLSYDNTFAITIANIAEFLPTITLSAQPNATTGGDLVTFTAAVSPNPGNLGTMTFRDGGTALAAGVPVVAGIATYQTSTLAPGTHAIAADYSGAASLDASTSNTLTFGVTASAPQLTSVTPNSINTGTGVMQSSRVASLVVTFNQPVQIDASALTLALHTNNVVYGGVAQPSGMGALPTSLAWSTTDNVTWIATFTGNTDDGADGIHSLKDGVYDLKISAAKVHPLGVPALSMAADKTTTFHRLFGDLDAPETPAGGVPNVDFQTLVNTGDNLAFRDAFNKAPGAGYINYFDFDGSGLINTGDNLAFRDRFNRTLSWRI